MRVHIKTTWQWNDGMGRYVKVYDDCYEYEGPVALACGAGSQQKQIGQAQQSFFNQLTQQATQVFGGASQVFQNLVNTFTPTIKAGPNQEGFSPAELSAMKSQAITNVGQGYKNVKAAVGNAQAAYGGGNVSLPTGVNEATDLGAAINAADTQSSLLNNITQADYAAGRENYNNAVKGLEGATSVFNPAATMAGQATGAGEAAASTANQIAQQNNGWMSAVSGVLGSVAGAASGGLTKAATGWAKGLGGRQGGGPSNVDVNAASADGG